MNSAARCLRSTPLADPPDGTATACYGTGCCGGGRCCAVAATAAAVAGRGGRRVVRVIAAAAISRLENVLYSSRCWEGQEQAARDEPSPCDRGAPQAANGVRQAEPETNTSYQQLPVKFALLTVIAHSKESLVGQARAIVARHGRHMRLTHGAALSRQRPGRARAGRERSAVLL